VLLPLFLKYCRRLVHFLISQRQYFKNGGSSYLINGPVCLIPPYTIIRNYWIFVNAGCCSLVVHQTVNVMIHVPTNHSSTDL
jgi:hypothetical protein